MVRTCGFVGGASAGPRGASAGVRRCARSPRRVGAVAAKGAATVVETEGTRRELAMMETLTRARAAEVAVLALEGAACCDDEEVDAAVCTLYRHVFGPAWEPVLESDAGVSAAEALLFDGLLTLRSFLALVAKSRTFRVMFFEHKTAPFFVEQTMLRLLGRAPHNDAEVAKYVLILRANGYDAVVDAMVESHEFDKLFGNHSVPLHIDVLASLPAL
eukprot:CAMPEP_0185829440 /NCGR_PEP_ID=MMETSP1353-20130828/251_1 /TAXON_ID=1077150 /ORGANISM="Erythrolobus australicus, Strain CCMP3124" /LENGTH=215 /DNA_ID=CAMNT_0028527233 /DNA_START=29 /DNA_END=676 /DNA_ORIENTATION=-